MLNPDLLRSFVAVAENGGFTRAAKMLNSTQSTISAQIQRLESEAGRPLFMRNTRSVQLTAAGETLLGYARTILRLNEDAKLRLSGARHAGRLRIGTNEDLADAWLPAILRRLGRRYPDVAVELEIGIGANLFQKVATQELDLAVGSLSRESVHGQILWKEPLVWAFSARAVLPDVLPLAIFPEPCAYREEALRALAGSQRQWRIACTSASLAGVRAAALAGLAVTPLPKHTISPGLCILGKRDNLPSLPEIAYVLQTSSSETRHTVAAFEALIREQAADALSGGGMTTAAQL